MKFEDRVQLKLSDLTEELFKKIVAYGFCAPWLIKEQRISSK